MKVPNSIQGVLIGIFLLMIVAIVVFVIAPLLPSWAP